MAMPWRSAANAPQQLNTTLLAASPSNHTQSIGMAEQGAWLIEGANAPILATRLANAASATHDSLWDWLDTALPENLEPGIPCEGVCVWITPSGIEAAVFGEATLAMACEKDIDEIRVWRDPRLYTLLASARNFETTMREKKCDPKTLQKRLMPQIDRCRDLANRPGGWSALTANGDGLETACCQSRSITLHTRIALVSPALTRQANLKINAYGWDAVFSETPDALRKAWEHSDTACAILSPDSPSAMLRIDIRPTEGV